MGNETHSATVETLTASVRTLMIDKRMVTMSMAKQLDFIDVAYLDVIFGRVKLDPSRRGVTVVGADAHGRLRVAHVAAHSDDHSVINIGPEQTAEKFFVCVGTAHAGNVEALSFGRGYRVRRGRHVLHLRDELVGRRTCGAKGAICECKEPWGFADPSRANVAMDAIREAERIQAKRPAKSAEARASELLILAGLR